MNPKNGLDTAADYKNSFIFDRRGKITGQGISNYLLRLFCEFGAFPWL